MIESPSREWRGITLCLAVAAVMTWWTWGTWLDPFIDFGRELYLPWQIVEGKSLYKDLASFNGPLSPYVNAAWFTLFGVGLRSLVIGNLIILSLLIVVLYRLLRNVADEFSTTIACLLFVLLFAFGEYDDVGNYNYITPYSHDLVHGIVTTFLSLLFLFSFIRSRRRRYAVGAGLLLGMTLLTKPEVSIAAIVSGTAGLAIGLRHAELRMRLEYFGIWLFCTALPVTSATLLLHSQMSVRVAASGISQPFHYLFMPALHNQPFYADMLGLSTPMSSMWSTAAACLVWFSVTSTVIAATRVLKKTSYVEGMAILGLTLLPAAVVFNRLIVDEFAKPLPFFAAILSMGLFWHWLKASDSKTQEHLGYRLTLCLFATALSLKMALNAHLRGYGFALLMPAFVVLVVSSICWLPHALAAIGVDARRIRMHLTLVYAIVTALYISAHRERINKTTESIGAGPDRFLSDKRSAPLNRALQSIVQRVGSSDKLVVMPEGIMLNYLTRRPSPSRFNNFLPPELTMFGASTVVGDLRRSEPEFVAVVNRPLNEYGYPSSGIEFSADLKAWVSENYKLVDGAPSDDRTTFAVTLYQRQR